MVFVAHCFCCFFMTGLIWTIQLVHYPAFQHVDEGRFQEFTAFHSRRISWIVGPVMLVELCTAAALWFAVPNLVWSLNLGVLLLTWLCTALLSMRCHDELALGKNPTALTYLIITNWPRTVFWSLRSILLLGMIGIGVRL